MQLAIILQEAAGLCTNHPEDLSPLPPLYYTNRFTLNYTNRFTLRSALYCRSVMYLFTEDLPLSLMCLLSVHAPGSPLYSLAIRRLGRDLVLVEVEISLSFTSPHRCCATYLRSMSKCSLSQKPIAETMVAALTTVPLAEALRPAAMNTSSLGI
jgi:hypothetical protein